MQSTSSWQNLSHACHLASRVLEESFGPLPLPYGEVGAASEVGHFPNPGRGSDAERHKRMADALCTIQKTSTIYLVSLTVQMKGPNTHAFEHLALGSTAAKG